MDAVFARAVKRTVLDEDTGCWLFMGARNSMGQGTVRVGQKNQYIHRLAWRWLRKRAISAEDKVFHLACCPNSNCWNPAHLGCGTYLDLQRESIARGTKSRGTLHSVATKRGRAKSGVHSRVASPFSALGVR